MKIFWCLAPGAIGPEVISLSCSSGWKLGGTSTPPAEAKIASAGGVFEVHDVQVSTIPQDVAFLSTSFLVLTKASAFLTIPYRRQKTPSVRARLMFVLHRVADVDDRNSTWRVLIDAPISGRPPLFLPCENVIFKL